MQDPSWHWWESCPPMWEMWIHPLNRRSPGVRKWVTHPGILPPGIPVERGSLAGYSPEVM